MLMKVWLSTIKKTFEDWFADDDFASKNVKISGKSKAHIAELIKKNR